MRIRLLISFAAFFALAGCNEQQTPKPRLPSTVTAPITQPARPDLTLAPPAAVVCPPQPVLVCPPAVAPHRVAAAPAKVRRVKHVKPAARRPAHRGWRHAHGYHHHRHHEDGYAHRDEYPHPHHGYPAPPRDDRYAEDEDAHLHAYGQDGAVAHFARREDYRVEDRYSAGGYEHHEMHSERYVGPGRGSEEETRRSGSSYSESYSERYSERGGTAYDHPGCCRDGGDEAAGRDANGYLTWPGKIPARP